MAGKAWKRTQTLTLRNVCTRRLHLTLAARPEAASRRCSRSASSRQTLVLRQGASATVRVTAALAAPADRRGRQRDDRRHAGRRPAAAGPVGDRLPALHRRAARERAALRDELRAVGAAPARLSVDAGALVAAAESPELDRVARLDVELWRGSQRLGLLARVRDLLPGRHTFGLTGRDPAGTSSGPATTGSASSPGRRAAAEPTVRSLAFTVT